MKIQDLQAARDLGTKVERILKAEGQLSEEDLVRKLDPSGNLELSTFECSTLREFVTKYAPRAEHAEARSGKRFWYLPAPEPRGDPEASPDKNAAQEPREHTWKKLERWFGESASGDAVSLDDFCRALSEGNDVDRAIERRSDLFARDVPHTQRRFIAQSLVRLLGVAPDIVEGDPGFRVKAVALIEEVLPDLTKHLEIDASAQGFQKLAALREASAAGTGRMASMVERLDNGHDLSGWVQEFNKALKSALLVNTVVPFLRHTSFAQSVSQVVAAAESYFSSEPRGALEAKAAFEQSSANFGITLSDEKEEYAARYGTAIVSALRRRVDRHFESSPASRPGKISVRATEKRYPFSEEGASVAIGFVLENDGAGFAIDVRLTLEVGDELTVDEPERYAGTIAPRHVFGEVAFVSTVAEPTGDPIPATLSVSWTNSDGARDSHAISVDLQCQAGGVPWEDLRQEDPYSLEPVSDTGDLVGRSDLLATLESKLKAKNVGSFLVWGQKRVGKTSVARTLSTRLEADRLQDFAPIYLEAGDYIDPSGELTVQRLGKRLCEEIKRVDRRFQHLSTPEFSEALSPLTDFLRDVHDVAPQKKFVFILDEFDELPLELFRRGGIGDAFFLTLRSISGKPTFGFVLVGGEKMEFIMSAKGDALNKFTAIRLDYFDREHHWSDFEDLIRRPLSRWPIEVTDEAIIANYEASAGNPYFAKIVCGHLFDDLVRRRDGHVTAREMDRAYSKAVNEAQTHRFQHFWEDGIFGATGEVREQVSVRRRQVLLAFAATLRKQSESTEDSVISAAAQYGLTGSEVAEELKNFLRRRVLARRDDGQLEATVRIFQRWLAERGVAEIVTTFTDKDAVMERVSRDEALRVTPGEIEEVTENWGLYRGHQVGGESVRAWLNQFDTVDEQRQMFGILQGLTFYSDTRVRDLLSEGHNGIVVPKLAQRGIARRTEPGGRKRTDNLLVSHFGGAGKSGPSFTRLYVDSNDIFFDRAVEPEKLGRAIEEKDDVSLIVFVDDFVGTGTQARDAMLPILAKARDQIADNGIGVVLLFTVGVAEAAEELETWLRKKTDLDIEVRVVQALDDRDRCFSDSSRFFRDASQRVKARHTANRYGESLERRHPLGFGGCELAVVFQYSCPNNALPILWKQAKDWRPLFPRG